MATQEACIHGVGLVTAVGMGSAQTSSSILAGLVGFRESAVLSQDVEPMVMGLLPEAALPPVQDELLALPGVTARQRRLLRLATPALHEAVAELPVPADSVPLFLAGPEKHPELPAPIGDAFLDQLHAQSGASFDREGSELFSTGRAGGFQALQAALERLGRGDTECALVGGVDSFLDLMLLATLQAEERVLTGGVMDGFIPGEGAGFVLLAREGSPAFAGASPLARVPAARVALEPGHRYSEEPYRGDGLALALAELFAAPEALREAVRSVYLGFNGESFPAKEWGVAAMRSSGEFDPELDVRHPADCFGDLGAAAGVVSMGLAALGIAAGSCAAPCLVWASSEGPERGAALVDLASA